MNWILIVLDDPGKANLLQLTNVDNDNTNGTTHKEDSRPSLASIEVNNLVIGSDT